ncbi:hypothetical protein QZM22_18385 [Burkholderia oklahomensis]|uniref:hypothetical protein n=1 Tax=Burkholderia oklahomensis TaxID=342113 RepID=UPI0026519870|nr:hypothetical protein [Burkholderia oklahomensis]MDN7674442.1 hypothetical protein [Burkholderia oklahomensis]
MAAMSRMSGSRCADGGSKPIRPAHVRGVRGVDMRVGDMRVGDSLLGRASTRREKRTETEQENENAFHIVFADAASEFACRYCDGHALKACLTIRFERRSTSTHSLRCANHYVKIHNVI